MENLVAHIQSLQPSLPKQQRQLCDYICNHLFEASMLTIAELAEKAGVGTATVTRMVYSLGYDSYSQLKLDLREQAVSRAHLSYSGYQDMYQGKVAEFSVSDELEMCRNMIHSMNSPVFASQIEIAAKAILGAQHTYILGLRTSKVAALCLEYRLNDVGIPARPLSTESEFLFDALIDLQPQDLLIVFASKPVTKKTMEVLRICRRQGIPTVVLVTEFFKELEDCATYLISTNTFDALLAMVPTVAAAELLACEVGRWRSGANQERYSRIERLTKENGVAIWDE